MPTGKEVKLQLLLASSTEGIARDMIDSSREALQEQPEPTRHISEKHLQLGDGGAPGFTVSKFEVSASERESVELPVVAAPPVFAPAPSPAPAQMVEMQVQSLSVAVELAHTDQSEQVY